MRSALEITLTLKLRGNTVNYQNREYFVIEGAWKIMACNLNHENLSSILPGLSMGKTQLIKHHVGLYDTNTQISRNSSECSAAINKLIQILKKHFMYNKLKKLINFWLTKAEWVAENTNVRLTLICPSRRILLIFDTVRSTLLNRLRFSLHCTDLSL